VSSRFPPLPSPALQRGVHVLYDIPHQHADDCSLTGAARGLVVTVFSAASTTSSSSGTSASSAD